MNRQDACSTKSEFSCGVGILPVPERLIDIGTSIDLFYPKVRSNLIQAAAERFCDRH